MRRIRLRLSLKVGLAITLFLLAAFTLVISLVIVTVTNQARQSLTNQITSYATLATKPVGDAFILYQDSGTTLLEQRIRAIADLNVAVGNVSIFDVNGQLLFRLKENESSTISTAEATLFNPVFRSDDEGFLRQVIYPYIEDTGVHRYTVVYDVSAVESKTSVTKLQNEIILTGLGILIAADILFVGLIEYLFVSPLRKMSRLAASISAGEYGQLSQLRRKDEMGDLSRALNAMAAKLQEDIERLKTAEQLKSEFLIISSHNFRTPLTVITGYLDLLKDLPLDEKAQEYVATVDDYAHQLTSLTNDMLTVAELEGNDQPQLTLETIELTGMLHQLVSGIEQRLAQKQQVLHLELEDDPIAVRAHITYLQTAIWNLVDNASKFTPARGIITLSTETDAHNVRVSVKDTGVGISQAEQAQLFTKFHRGTSTMKYEYEGIGLGLYMTKLMIELMGGTIDVQSREGEGSTFTIRLPRTANAEPSASRPDPLVFRSGLHNTEND